jgi:2-polyprenyl-3-methyl-5-hydroxy-6-metoxy-1,4-benzoquinol methylase/peptidoglycan hydrolase CwlO-like protein
MTQVTKCWCGNEYLTPFSEDYLACPECGTLVSQAGLSREQLQVHDDEHDFYGKEYWFSHQTQDYGFPDISQRARQDLSERCLHWLSTLLQYKLPPAKVLELGSAHGGFVALMHWAGFDATGLELSPWVVEFAQKTFEVPVLLGAVEEHSLKVESFDAIVLFDVLEHLPDPVSTMRHCASLLKPDGIFLIQMPNYLEDKSYSDLLVQEDGFSQMLTPTEHLYLFSHRAAQQLFEQIDFSTVKFESPFFPYDMFFVASRQFLSSYTHAEIRQAFATPSGRLIQALLDKGAESIQLQEKLQFVEADRTKAFQIVEKFEQDVQTLTAQLQNTQSELERSQNELYETNSKYLFAQSQFELTHQELVQTQAQLAQTRIELKNRQSQLDKAQLKLSEIQQKVVNLKSKLQELRIKLKEQQTELNAMTTSKFWKLRTRWFKFKDLLRSALKS